MLQLIKFKIIDISSGGGCFLWTSSTYRKVDQSKNSTHQLFESVRQNYFQAMKFDLHL
jgi:hypothetical protein